MITNTTTSERVERQTLTVLRAIDIVADETGRLMGTGLGFELTLAGNRVTGEVYTDANRYKPGKAYRAVIVWDTEVRVRRVDPERGITGEIVLQGDQVDNALAIFGVVL